MLDVLHDGIGISTLTACVTERPNIPTPNLRVEFIQVQGRHGSVSIVDAYDDITFDVEYNVLEDHNIKPLIRQIKGFFVGKKMLQFSDDAVFYKIKKAQVKETSNEIEEYGVFTVEYTCDPFQYIQGTAYVAVSNGGTIDNPGTVESAPLIKVTGSGAGTVTINGETLNIIDLDKEIIIDAELKNAYTGTELSAVSNRNRNVRGYIPLLKVGENTIAYSGGVTGVQIDGRWRFI